MATATRTPSIGQRAACLFDQRRSTKLNELVIALEASPPRLRARILRMHTSWLERQMPAFHTGRAAR